MKDELAEVRGRYADKRRTRIGAAERWSTTEAFIVDEDANVVLTRDGWVKRVRELKDPRRPASARATRWRRCWHGSPRRPSSSSPTTARPTCRVNDGPVDGYGDPIQKCSSSTTASGWWRRLARPRIKPKEDNLLAVTAQGMAFRFALAATGGLDAHRAPFGKPGEGDEVIGVSGRSPTTIVIPRLGALAGAASAAPASSTSEPGQGRHRHEDERGDRLLAFTVNEPLVAETGKGQEVGSIRRPASVQSRGGKGPG